jgi:membrane-bound serine protease (ClpP class)
MSWAEHLVRFLTDPVVGGLLMMFGMAGIGIELYHPGVGLPGAVGVICLGLFFFGHFMTHLAGIEEVVLIGIGVVLMALEIFVIPGFGAAGIAGIALLAVGLLLAMLGLDLDVSLETGAIWIALLRVGASLGLAAMVFLGFLYLFPQSRLANRLVLQEQVGGKSGTSAAAAPDEQIAVVGMIGKALGDLRPAGIIDIDGLRVDVVTEGDYVTKGTRVQVLEIKGNRVVVRPVDDQA